MCDPSYYFDILEGISMAEGGLMRRLRMQDTEIMTFGMWVDYVIEWNNTHLAEKKHEKKKATQSDYDCF